MIEIACDGSCLGPPGPGPGGWAAVLLASGGETVLTGGASETTHNRMELEAAIAAASLAPADSFAVVVSDSEYVVKGINGGVDTGVDYWIRNGWRNKDNELVKNPDLWRRLAAARDARPWLEFKWVRARSGHAGNERADKLAKEEAARWQRRHGAAPPRR